MTLFRIVSEIQWDIGWKLQIFGTSLLFGAPAEGDPIGILQSGRVSCGETRMMGPPGNEKSLMVSLAVSIQYTNATDGQTDGRTDRRTDTGWQQRPRYA